MKIGMVFKRRTEKWEVIEEWRKDEKWEWRGTAAQSGEESRYVSFFFYLFFLLSHDFIIFFSSLHIYGSCLWYIVYYNH